MSGSPVAGFTSTRSKRPEALFGTDGSWLPPGRMVRAEGSRVWDANGREYLDLVMALGAVALGYGHPSVARAAIAAIEAGVVGPLAPVLEEELAADFRRLMPWIEQLRFLKSGAEACAAAVRLARVATGRDLVLGCGYHGWLDWCEGSAGSSTRAASAKLFWWYRTRANSKRTPTSAGASVSACWSRGRLSAGRFWRNRNAPYAR